MIFWATNVMLGVDGVAEGVVLMIFSTTNVILIPPRVDGVAATTI